MLLCINRRLMAIFTKKTSGDFYQENEFHGLKHKSNSTSNRDPVHSMHTNVTWKIIFSGPKNWAEDQQKCQKKIRKKDSYRWFHWSKPHWSALEWFITLSLATLLRYNFQRYSKTNSQKKLRFFKKCCKKCQFEEKKQLFFVQSGASICSRSFSLFNRMLFLIMKRGCASPVTELLEFFEKMEQNLLKKKTQKFEFGQTITDVLGCNTIRWTEIAFKESKKLKAVGYLEILKNHEEKLHFLDVIFQQGNAPVHKSKINGDFYQKNQWRFLPRKRVSWSKTQKQLNFKSRSSAQYAYKRYLKNNIFWAKKLSRRPIKMSKKNQKKR